MTRTCEHCGATTSVVHSTRTLAAARTGKPVQGGAQQAVCCKAYLRRHGIKWGALATTADVQALVDQHRGVTA